MTQTIAPERPATCTTAPHVASPGFVDPNVQQSYHQLGFQTMPLLHPEDVQTLTQLFDLLLPELPDGFASTVLMPPDLRRAAHLAICDVLAAPLSGVLQDFRVVMGSLVARAPGSDQRDLPLHQDWSFVDESRARSVSVWIPLQDVDAENGCLQVVPGSHRHDQPLRGIGSGFRYRAAEAELRARHLHDLLMRAGEAVFFDHRLIHGSRGNDSALPRLAVGAVLLERDVPLVMGQPEEQGWRFAPLPDDFLMEADLTALARKGAGRE